MADIERLLVTGDLHFGLYPAGDECVLELAEFVRDSGADALAIAGDLADADTDSFRACLDLFAGFNGLKLLVPGNHDLWSAGDGSQKKYREVLPSIASSCGFKMLDTGPVILGGIGFIGNIGWYDYSFRNPELNASLERYESKQLPGVCTWNDGRFVDWDVSDVQFTEKCRRKLQVAYRSIEPRVHTVVAVMHTVPFRELLYPRSSVAFEFCRAYMGSERIGRMLLDFRKVRYVFCGHRHGPEEAKVGHIEAFVVGSEYLVKRIIELNLTTGEHSARVFEPTPEAVQEMKTDVIPPEEP